MNRIYPVGASIVEKKTVIFIRSNIAFALAAVFGISLCMTVNYSWILNVTSLKHDLSFGKTLFFWFASLGELLLFVFLFFSVLYLFLGILGINLRCGQYPVLEYTILSMPIWRKPYQFEDIFIGFKESRELTEKEKKRNRYAKEPVLPSAALVYITSQKIGIKWIVFRSENNQLALARMKQISHDYNIKQIEEEIISPQTLKKRDRFSKVVIGVVMLWSAIFLFFCFYYYWEYTHLKH